MVLVQEVEYHFVEKPWRQALRVAFHLFLIAGAVEFYLHAILETHGIIGLCHINFHPDETDALAWKISGYELLRLDGKFLEGDDAVRVFGMEDEGAY